MTFSSLAHRLRQDLLPSTYIGQYVVLQKRGGIFMGLCPFHGEKTPSFHVHDGKKRYHCFGCGVHGDIFDFAKEYLGLSFREALDIFCQQLGYTPPSEEYKYQHQEQQKVTRRKTPHPLLQQKSSAIKKDFSSHQKQNISKKSLQSFSNYPQKESVSFEENDLPGNQEIFSEDFLHQHQKNSSFVSFSKAHKERLYLVLDLVRLWATHKLRCPQGAEALHYVQKKRHISPKAISLFSLGYIGPEGLKELWDIFRFSAQELHEVGLLGKRPQGSYYNLFRHRLLFPIWDFYGRCIAFGGRDLSEDYPLSPLSSSRDSKGPKISEGFLHSTHKKDFSLTSLPEPFHQPKYLNSPQTVFFKKNTALYGLPRSLGFSGDRTLDFLKKAQQDHPSRASYFRDLQRLQEEHKQNLLQEAKHHQQKDLFIVEGYFDVIGLFDAGFLAVAPLGTAFGEYHLQHLWSSYDEPIVCFDGDEAGSKAAKKVAYLAASLLKPGKSLRFILLDKNLDPHSFLTRYYDPQSPEEQLLLHQYQEAFQQKVQKEFQDLKNKSLPLWLFLYHHIFQHTTPEGQVQDQEEWNKVLQSIPQKDIAQKYQALAQEKNFLDKRQKKGKKHQKTSQNAFFLPSSFPSSSLPSFPLSASSSNYSQESPGFLGLSLETPSVSSSFSRPPKKHVSKTIDTFKESSQPSYHHYEKYQESLTLQSPQVDQQKNKDIALSPNYMFHPLPYGFLVFLAFSYDFLQEAQEECLQILQDHHKNFFSSGKQVPFSSLDPAFQETYKHQGEKMQKIFLMMWEFMVYWKNRQKIYIILTPSSPSFDKKDPQDTTESYESLCSVLPSFFQDFACFYPHFPLSWPRPSVMNLSFEEHREPQTFKESLGVVKKNIEDYWRHLWNTYMMTSYQQRDIEALKTALRQGGKDQDLLWRRLQTMTSLSS